MQEPVPLQVGHILLVLFGRKLAGLVFEDCLHGLIRGGVKENDRRDVFSKGFHDAGDLLGRDPHTDAAMACTEPEGDQLARGPFTSFEAAQSSRMIRVFVASKKKVASFRKSSTSCCDQLITKMRGSLSTKPSKVLLWTKVRKIVIAFVLERHPNFVLGVLCYSGKIRDFFSCLVIRLAPPKILLCFSGANSRAGTGICFGLAFEFLLTSRRLACRVQTGVGKLVFALSRWLFLPCCGK